MNPRNLLFTAIFAGMVSAALAQALEVGVEAPEFNLPDILTGEDFAISDYRGQVVVINFWAYWCEFCELAAPAFQEQLVEIYQPLGVVFIGLEKGERRPSFSGNITDPRDFVETFGWDFKNGIDRDRSIFAAYEGTMDQYMVIGMNGRAAYISGITGFEEGAIDIPALSEAIELALEGAVPVEPVSWSRIKTLWVP